MPEDPLQTAQGTKPVRAYLPDYELVRAQSLDDALVKLAEAPAEWTILAGGTDLMVLLAAGKLPPGRFLSIWGLKELQGIRLDDEYATIGALTTYTQIRRHATLREEMPMLCLAAGESGATAIQNRGTLGGNVINASPAADSPPALLAYDAELELVSQSGSRWVPLDGFHTGYKQMDKKPDELLRALRVPRRPGGANAVHYYRKVGTRSAQAISKVVMAALGRIQDGRVAHIRVALGSVAPTVVRARASEKRLKGAALTPELVLDACAQLQKEIAPIDDVRSTAHYRRAVAGNLLEDFLLRLSHSG